MILDVYKRPKALVSIFPRLSVKMCIILWPSPKLTEERITPSVFVNLDFKAAIYQRLF